MVVGLAAAPRPDAAVAAAGADLQLFKSDSPDPVAAGANITYSIQVVNDPSTPGSGVDALSVSFSETLPANTTLVSVTLPAGWTRTDAVPVGGTGTITATTASIPAGTAPALTLVVKVDGPTALGTTITNTASTSSTTTDPNAANNSASTTTTVSGTVAVLLRSLVARAGSNGVLVRWRTAVETETLGFNLYRQRRGRLVRLNRSLIRSVGGATRGHAYLWLDRGAGSGTMTTYRLQAVRFDGSRSWLGSSTVR